MAYPMMRKTLRDEIKLANLLPPLFICIIMGIIWSVYSCLHLAPQLQIGVPERLRDQEMAARGSSHAVVSQTLIALFLICYMRAILTSPGGVPDTEEWRMGILDSSNLPATKEVKITGERRHCKWCLRYKPDRCHHCRVCKTCVLKMDHHCPWIMNCVGWGNHKYFFLLVVYAVLSCNFIFFTVLQSVHACVHKEMPHINRFLLVLCAVLAFIMGGLMTAFLGFHTWLMFSGMTTIEFCEKATGGSPSSLSKTPNYDSGVWNNITVILGPRPVFWFLPFDPATGDGMKHRLKVGGREPGAGGEALLVAT